MHPCVSYAFYNKMRKKMRKMMRKIASVRKMMRKVAVMRKIMRKTMRKITFMRKMMRKIVSMRRMMRKMKISSSKGEYLSKMLYAMLSIGVKVKYSRSEQHKTFKFHLLAQNIYCLSN